VSVNSDIPTTGIVTLLTLFLDIELLSNTDSRQEKEETNNNDDDGNSIGK